MSNLIAQRPNRRWIAVVLGLLALALFSAPVHAAEFRADESTVTVAVGETVYGDLFVGARSLVIDGTVNGDVFVGATTITIRGTVNGSVTGAGQSIRIEGPIAHGARVAGDQIVIAAPVGRDLIVAGQSLDVTAAGSIGGDAIIATNEVTLAGPVGARVLGFAENLRLSGQVGRHVDVEIGELVVEPSARISGDLLYRSQNRAQIPAETVGGQVRYDAAETDSGADDVGAMILGAVRWSAAWIVAQALLGLLLFAVARGWMERAAGQIRRRPGVSLLTGLVAAIATVPAILIVGVILVVVFALVFGGGVLAAVPAPIFGFGLYALALYISPVFVALLIGHLLLDRLQIGRFGGSGLVALLLGLVLLSLLGAIPWAGWILTGLATVFGLGGALLAAQGAPSEPEST